MRYAEDFIIGETEHLGEYVLEVNEIVDFASKYDPQPYHLDHKLAEKSAFHGLIASGWNTACVWMKLYVEKSLKDAFVAGSPGVDEMRWFKPIKPGSTLVGSVTALKHVPNLSKRNIITIQKKGVLTIKGEEKPAFSLIIYSRLHKDPTTAEPSQRGG